MLPLLESGSSRNETLHTPLLGTSGQPIRNLFQQQCKRCHQAIYLNIARAHVQKKKFVLLLGFNSRVQLPEHAQKPRGCERLFIYLFILSQICRAEKALWGKIVHAYW